MSDEYKWGWISNDLQARVAKSQGRYSDVDKLHELIAPWDGTDKPTIISWSEYANRLAELAKEADAKRAAGLLKNWWETSVYRDGLLIDSQGFAPSCAGVSMFDRCYQTTLINQIAAGSEQVIEPVNAIVTWMISKGGSRSGGQTIAAVLNYGAEVGVYPAALVGEYEAGARYDADWRKYDSEAAKRQIGACLLEDSDGSGLNSNDMTDAIVLACRAGKAVEIGQSVGVRSGRTTDSNGVSVVQLGGSWAHATAFSGWKQVNGVEYVYWLNSHGRIYESTDGSPAIGGWMQKETLMDFCSCRYCDAAIITYVESPHGADNLNLNPYGISEVIQ